MSSDTSTEAPRLATADTDSHGTPDQPRPRGERATASFQPWQLFTLAGLISAAIVAFFASAQPPPARVFLILTIFAAAVIGVAALRMLIPLTGVMTSYRGSTLGERTRAALEREKLLALRSLKDLEFDRAMGKVSEKDHEELTIRLRARAGRILRQLDAGESAVYREAIEREIARRVGVAPVAQSAPARVSAPSGPAVRHCAACDVSNDADAQFCKRCGARLEA